MIIPEALKAGDEIRVIAPSSSMTMLKKEQINLAMKNLTELGYKVSIASNAFHYNEFYSSTVGERLEDIKQAILDSNIKAIVSALSGYTANQLLDQLPYDLIKEHPKVWLGYGDMTALTLAIHAKTGLMTFSGPDFSTFGIKAEFQYISDFFQKAISKRESYPIVSSSHWHENAWYIDQEKCSYHENKGFYVINEGSAEGKALSGNLSTWNLLHGTTWMPDLIDSILFIEDNAESHIMIFERMLQALLQQPNANRIKAIIIGRFQSASQITQYALETLIKAKPELARIPVIADFNFGHVLPFATIANGINIKLKVTQKNVSIFCDFTEKNS